MKLKKDKIYLLMAKNRMSVSDIADRCGKSKQRISCIFNSLNVTPKTVGMIAEALKCDVTDILED